MQALLLFVSFALISPSAHAQGQARTLSLEQAISSALGVGEEVTIAHAGVARAEGNVEIAKSQFLPQISAALTYTRTLQSQYSGVSTGSSSSQNSTDTSKSGSGSNLSSLFKNLPFGRENSWTVALQASENIYTGGRMTAQREAAEARARSAQIDLTAAQAQLVLNVTQSYYDAVLSDQLVKISRDALNQADEVYKLTELAYKVGEKAEFEALRAKVSRDNQVPQLVQNENNRALAYYRLKQLLNLPLGDSLVLTSGVDDTVGRFAAESDTAMDARASVAQARENVSASEAQVTVAKSARLPQVSISTRYAPVAYPDNIFPSYSDFHADWTASLNVSVPIYTGGYISANEDVAEAGVLEANGRLEQAREAAALDARAAINDLRAAQANLKATRGTVSEAERAYQIARIRYQQGISTQIELNDTRLQEEQSRANYARAQRNFQVARAKVSLLKDLPVNPGQAAIAGSSAQTAVTQQQSTGASSTTFTGPSTGSPSGASPSGGASQTGGGQTGP